MRLGSVTLLLYSMGAAWLGVPAASALDIHHFWDQRCHECHGHAAAFARSRLIVESGELKGLHHRDDLRRFLGQHEMGPALVEPIYGMLLAEATTQPLYQQKCFACHGSAADLARSSLMLRDGVLVAKGNQRAVGEFLVRHGKLTGEEVGRMIETLRRVHGEVSGGPVR